MRHIYIKFALLLSLIQPFTTILASDLPELGDASETALSLQDEAKIGENAYQAMLNNNEILSDTEINTYINKIGQRLSSQAHTPQKFIFFVVDDNSINAFAMPGGYVGVNRGLVLTTQSEGELASVIGHESAHVIQHHIARMQATGTENKLLILAAVAASALAASQGRGDIASGALQTGIGLSISNQLSYSRDFEREADRIGMQYLAGSGFDARSMPAFFERLQNASKFTDNNAYAFLRDHPVTSERISEAQNRAAKYPLHMVADSEDYLLVREKLRVSSLEAREAVRYYQTALSSGRYLNEGAEYYGLARAYLRLRNFPAANQALSEAMKKLPQNPMLLSTKAEIMRFSGNLSLAISNYQKALLIYPQNKALIYGELDVLLDRNARESALARMKQFLALYPEDPELYQREARLYVGHDSLRYHAALGNAFYFSRQYSSALEQYQLASVANGDDFYLRSSIDVRIKELRANLNQNKK